MAMGKHPAICSAEAGLKIKMHGCAIWPGHGPVPTQCQLCSQSTENEIMKNCHEPVGAGTVRKESARATRSTPELSNSARSFPVHVIRSGQSLIGSIKSSTSDTEAAKMKNGQVE